MVKEMKNIQNVNILQSLQDYDESNINYFYNKDAKTLTIKNEFSFASYKIDEKFNLSVLNLEAYDDNWFEMCCHHEVCTCLDISKEQIEKNTIHIAEDLNTIVFSILKAQNLPHSVDDVCLLISKSYNEPPIYVNDIYGDYSDYLLKNKIFTQIKKCHDLM